MKLKFKGIRTLEPNNFLPVPCPCEHQLCSGSFLVTRLGQPSCIRSLAESGKLELYPVITVEMMAERFTLQQLIIYSLDIEIPLD